MPVCAEVGQEQAPTSPIELPQVGRRTQIAHGFLVPFRSLISIVLHNRCTEMFNVEHFCRLSWNTSPPALERFRNYFATVQCWTDNIPATTVN
jgi:hypothetical protein